MTDDINHIFAADGLLAHALPEYELRQGQIEMAQAVAHTLSLEDGASEPSTPEAEMLAVEAETGIGKTLAYLVPACLSGKKVVVSTGTLTLQEQILRKEIPFIKKHILPTLKAVCVKGRQNYACLYRCQQFLSTPQMQLFSRSQELEMLANWLDETKSGDRAELTWLPDNSPLWEKISTSTSKCLGAKCPDNAACFITRLRRKAGGAQILIVNHHLFFSDLGIRRFGHAEVLPRYQAVIFDEAHHIENVATRYFGTTFSHYQLLDLVKDIEETAGHLPKSERDKTVQIAGNLASQANLFSQLFPRQKGRYPLPEIIEKTTTWKQEVADLLNALNSLKTRLQAPALSAEIWDGFERRCQELTESLTMTTKEMNPASVYWCERRERTIALSAAPIEVAPELREHLYSQVDSIVFTSATLTAGGKFTYMFNRFGLGQKTKALRLPSPFDYRHRTRLYIPAQGFPEPASSHYPAKSQEQTLAILTASKGRALLLFTSISAMRQMRSFLADRLPYPILTQGDAPKHVLLETFQHQDDSVLLAVASFWEGVNVPGESLSCVIIDKLPFEVPSDPVIMARINRIKEEGGNPFFDFQVPRAILALRQGVGRLMRAATDQGLLSIMDIRLFTKGYGLIFLNSLPESPVIRDLDGVKEFFTI